MGHIKAAMVEGRFRAHRMLIHRGKQTHRRKQTRKTRKALAAVSGFRVGIAVASETVNENTYILSIRTTLLALWVKPSFIKLIGNRTMCQIKLYMALTKLTASHSAAFRNILISGTKR